MKTQLTLRLDDVLIMEAKKIAKQNNISLSQLVSNYFQTLTQENRPLPPITQSLIGVLDQKRVNPDEDKKYLEEKY